MVIVLSADTGALIVAAIVTMLPFESPTIHYPPPCCFTASLFRLCFHIPFIHQIRRKSTMLSFSFFSRRDRQDKTRDLGELHSSELDQVFSFKYLEKILQNQSDNMYLWTWNWMSSGCRIGSKQRRIRHPDDGSKSQTVRNPLSRPQYQYHELHFKVHWSIILSLRAHSFIRGDGVDYRAMFTQNLLHSQSKTV